LVEFLFLDLDDTILDFHKAERLALGKTFRSFGLEPTEEVMARYSLINKAHWERLERKELTREEVLVGRFAVLFQEFGLEVNPEACARAYEDNLSIGHYFLPGALEAVQSLSKKYKLYLASNGTAHVQEGRIKSANIERFFKDIFISQRVGAVKPKKEFFDYCFNTIKDFNKENAIIIGDSISSDILGGKNAGIKTCLYNPNHLPVTNDCADYIISDLLDVESLLKKL
jgi:2-haloacid dehalogenase